jgi:HEAT repeat protein
VANTDDFDADEEQAALVEALVSLAGDGEAPRSGLADETVELLASRLDGATERMRLCIATALGRIGRHRDAELVTSLLRDPSASVRRAAVEALSHVDVGAASEPLRLALADESPLVRIAAATALGASESDRVVEDLESLVHDADSRVRAATIRAIGGHFALAAAKAQGPRGEAVALVRHALDDDGLVAVAAVEALGQIGGEAAARVACELLDRDEPELVQAAVSCIGCHGDADALAELLQLISHPSWTVRAEVIQTLAERQMQQSVPHILRRLETEQDSFVRDTILRALKRLEV